MGSNPIMGPLGVAQSGQSAGFGSRRSSVQIAELISLERLRATSSAWSIIDPTRIVRPSFEKAIPWDQRPIGAS